MTARVFFVAGDLSGDQHAARVAAEIKRRSPGAEILAAGGPALEKAADVFLGNLVDQGVMGFWEPLKKIPFFLKFMKDVIRPALRDRAPDLVVPTDFFGFNRHVARAAKAAGRKVFYFISPQVWASRPGRIGVLKRCVDKMLVIFPFEQKLYRDAGVPVDFVGHPLLDEIPAPQGGGGHVEPVIGLLPGSRASEIRRHLPLFLSAADRLSSRRKGLRFVLFAAPSQPNEFYDRLLGTGARRPYLIEVVRDEGHQWRSGLDLAWTCSGTATLENALLGVPMVVLYKTSWPTYLLARALIRVEHIAMPNILAGKAVVPELVQRRANPALLAEITEDILGNREKQKQMRRDLAALRDVLGGPGAAGRAADAILAAVPAPAGAR